MTGEPRVDGETDFHGGNVASASPSVPQTIPSKVAWAALFVGTLAGCLLLAPREMNGDGIGYLKAAQAGTLYPGHLLYVPLLRAVWTTRTTLDSTHGDSIAGRGATVSGDAALPHRNGSAHREVGIASGVWPARVVSAACAAIAALLCGLIAQRRGGRGLVAGAGLAASAGLIGAGCDVESYAPALAALLGVVYCLELRRVSLAGVLLAVATLLHIENALFVGAALLLTPRGLRLRFLLAGGATCAVVVVALGAKLSSLPQASHGFHYPLHLYTPFVALWGALRTLVFMPYPYETSWTRLFILVPIAGAFVAVLLVEARAPFSRRVLCAWALPYAFVGLLFFPSDPERWLFLLPLVWLAQRCDLRSVALLALCNIALWVPHARDHAAIDRARAAATQLQDGDVVLMPGHGWDESIALFAPNVRPFPLVFHAAARGGAVGLGQALDEAIAHASRVVSVRLDADDSVLGWKELAAFGLDRASVRALLTAHHLTVAPGPKSEGDNDGVRVWTIRR